MSVLDKGIANQTTLAARVEAYQQAIEKIEVGYKLLAEAKQELEAAFGSHYSDFSPYPDRHNYYRDDNYTDGIVDHLRRSAWKCLIDLSGIRKILSVKRAEELDKQLASGKLDEITDENVIGMLSMLKDQSRDFAEEAVKEVYAFLRPGASDHNRYKTNQKQARWRLEKRVILTGAISHGWGSRPFNVSSYYSHTDRLRALDRVFAMLDGKGIPEGYISPLVDAINSSETGEGETEYFKFKACQNSNLHLYFKRPDLVTRLNQIAGGGYILPD